MKKIIFIVGSLRKASYNAQLAEIAARALQGRAEISVVRPDGVPLLNEDEEFPAPKAVAELRQKVVEADGIWIFTPEYNYNIPGAEKNLLDWLSRPVRKGDPERITPVIGKKVMVCGVGGKNATQSVRKHLVNLLKAMRMTVIGEDGLGFSLPVSAFVTGKWEPEERVFKDIALSAEKFLAALSI